MNKLKQLSAALFACLFIVTSCTRAPDTQTGEPTAALTSGQIETSDDSSADTTAGEPEQPAEELNIYRGEIHAHTSESDGVGTLEDAYTYARDVGGVDFFSVTDHSNSFTRGEFVKRMIAVADAFDDPGKFTALYGYELTYNISTGYWGHVNILNTDKVFDRSKKTLTETYAYSTEMDGAVAMFNHPGVKWGNFDEFGHYSAEADAFMDLIEIKGKSYEYEYALALAKGWHVSPCYSEDNHTSDWTTANTALTCALAPELTREAIIEAFNLHRTYSTLDKTLNVEYKVNGKWMGSVLTSPGTLNISVSLSTELASGLGTVMLVGEDMVVVDKIVLGSEQKYLWELSVPAEYDYYYIKVSSDSSWCLTAPVWIEDDGALEITEISQSVLPAAVGGENYSLDAVVTNSSGSDVTDVTAYLYLSGFSGFYATKTAYKELACGDIKAGGSVKISVPIPLSDDLGSRATLLVRGTREGQSVAAQTYTALSPVYITEIVALTEENKYDYFELYNNTPNTLNLNSYSIRYYVKAGASADQLTENTWKLTGVSIEPYSAVVVCVGGADAEKFNAYYGTELSDKELYFISGGDIADKNSAQFELLKGTSVINRVRYNWGDSFGLDAALKGGIEFAYQPDMVQTSLLISSSSVPSPATLSPDQVPPSP